ncbi:MAG: hypothetical protein M1504_01405 [Candidatus Marsarchaeota archaeon]|nr:hypothetical protein [Candidatus Marsarchaeota archaeon]
MKNTHKSRSLLTFLVLIFLATVISMLYQLGFPVAFFTIMGYTQTHAGFLPNLLFSPFSFIVDYLFWFGIASMFTAILSIFRRGTADVLLKKAHANLRFLIVAIMLPVFILLGLYYSYNTPLYFTNTADLQFPAQFYYVVSNCTASYGCIGQGSYSTAFFYPPMLIIDYIFWFGVFYFAYMLISFAKR